MKKKSMSQVSLPTRRICVGVAASLAFAIYPVAMHADEQNKAAIKLTPEEAKTMAEGLKPLLNDSVEGLPSVKHADGTVSTDLQGRFQNVTVAVKDPTTGVVTQACINNTEAAAGFLGIDRTLLDLPAKTEQPQPEKLSDR
jgi:DNA-binding protein Fis